MPEIRYKINAEGATELRELAEAQQQVRKNIEDTQAGLRDQDSALKSTAAAWEALTGSQQRASQGFAPFGQTQREADATTDALRRAKAALDDFNSSSNDRRAPRSGSGSYDPSAIENESAKSLLQAHRQLDAMVQKQQLSELSGLDRIQARRQILLQELGLDASLRAKINSLADREANAEQKTTASALKLKQLKEVETATRQVELITEKAQASELTGLQRIERERQKVLAQHGLTPQLQGKINSAYDVFAKQQSGGGNALSSIGGLSGLQMGIQSPLQSIGMYGAQAAESLGVAGIAAGAIAIGLGAAAVAAYKLVAGSAEAAKNIQNSSERLGLSTGAYQQLSAAAQVAGVSITSLEASARLLGNALEDPAGAGKKTAEAIGKLHLSVYDGNGALKDEGKLLLEVLDALSKVGRQSELVALGQAIFGRSSKEIIPLIERYKELKGVAAELGIGLDNTLIPSLAHADDEIQKLALSWQNAKNELAKAVAPIVIPIIVSLTNANRPDKPFQNGKRPGIQSDQSPDGWVASILAHLEKYDPTSSPDSPKTLQDEQFDFRPKEGDAAKADKAATEAIRFKRNSADAAKSKILSANNVEGLTEEKAKLEKEIRANQDKLIDPLFGDVDGTQRKEKHSETEKDLARVKEIEEKLKSLRKSGGGGQDSLLKQVENAEQRGRTFEQSGIEKIRESYVKLLAEVAKRPALLERVLAVEQKEIQIHQADQTVARLREELSLRTKIAGLFSTPGNEEHTLENVRNAGFRNATEVFNKQRHLTGHGNGDELQKSIDASQRAYESGLIDVGAQRTVADRNSRQSLATQAIRDKADADVTRIKNKDPFGGGKDDQATQDEIHKRRLKEINDLYVAETAYIGKTNAGYQQQAAIQHENAEYEKRSLEAQLKTTQDINKARAADISTRLKHAATIVSLTGTEDSLGNIQREADLQKTLALSEFESTKDQKALVRDLDEAEFSRVQKLLELRRGELDSFKNAAGELFDAIRSKGATGATEYFQGLGLSIAKKLTENIAGEAFRAVQDKIPTLGGQRDSKGNLTLFGSILKDTPLGEHAKIGDTSKLTKLPPDQQQRVDNNLKLADNTEALRANTQALLQRGGGGAGTGSGTGGGAGAGNPFAGAGAGMVGPEGVVEGTGLPGGTPGDFGGEVTAAVGTEGVPEGSAMPRGTNGDFGGETATPANPFSANTGKAGSADSPGSFGSTAIKAIGLAGAAFAGVQGVLSGIKQGGAKGALGAASSVLGTAAAFTSAIPVVGSVLAIAAIGTKLVDSLLGDPRQIRAKNMTRELEAAQYTAPASLNVVQGTNGDTLSRDFKGNVRTMNSTPGVSTYNKILGFDPYHFGMELSASQNQLTNNPLSGPGAALPGPDVADFGRSFTPEALQSQAAPAAKPVIQYNFTMPVSAMDSKDIVARAGAIGDAMYKVLQTTHKFNDALRGAVAPS